MPNRLSAENAELVWQAFRQAVDKDGLVSGTATAIAEVLASQIDSTYEDVAAYLRLFQRLRLVESYSIREYGISNRRYWKILRPNAHIALDANGYFIAVEEQT